MTQIWDIHGGIHPPENKHQSLATPLRDAGIPEEIILPLSQHIGAPAKPLVAPGDTVLKGQCIAEANGFVSAAVHASTSGRVSAIEDRVISHPSGMSGPCIIITPDGKDEWIEHEGVSDYSQLDKQTLIARIRDAGIAGMGGAGFPTAVKMSTRDDQRIETLIINGTECEPYITADDCLMQSKAEEVITGVRILQQIIAPQKTLIGIEDNKPKAIAAINKALQDDGSVLKQQYATEVVSFPTKYPSGGEKQLIQILTGREVPAGGLPADIGIVCQNIGSTRAIYRAVCLGEPLLERITTVTGNACQQPQNLNVLLGTPIKHILKEAGFNADKASRVIIGGPMMGYTVNELDVPVVKTTNCVLAPDSKELPLPDPAMPCIRCGMCAEACPASLLPQQLYWFAKGQELEKLEDHNLFDCIECGACSYVCPSNIPLVQYYRASKASIRKANADHQKAEQSKIRFEARNARLAALEEEKQAKRKARQQAAKAKSSDSGDTDKNAVIQAAIERAKAKKSEKNAEAPTTEQAAVTDAPQSETEQMHNAVNKAEKRLQEAATKLQELSKVDPEQAAKFAATLSNMHATVKQARAELNTTTQEATPSEETTHSDSSASQTAEPAATDNDPAAMAIARAMAKREQQQQMSPQEKLQQQVASLEKRLKKSQAALAKAEEEGSDNIDALGNAVTKLKDKLATAKEELATLSAGEN